MNEQELIKNINELDVKYLKITLIKQKNACFAKTFKVKDQLIVADTEGNISLNADVPQEVLLGFVTNDAMYFAKSILLTTKYTGSNITFVIKNPSEFRRQQKRKYFRVLSDLPVKISYEYNGKLNTKKCRMYDLSAGGIKVNLYGYAALPQKVDIAIEFNDRIIVASARLVNIYYNIKPLKASFEFMNIDPKDRDYISGYCIKKQAENLNSEKKTYSPS